MVKESTSIAKKRNKTSRGKRIVWTLAPIEEAKFFTIDAQYDRYRATTIKLVTPLKCQDIQFLQTRALSNLYQLLEQYKLVKFVSYNANCYPRLIRMLYTNLGVMPGKLYA